MKKTSITNLSFSIPNLGSNSAYQSLCNLILKTLVRPPPATVISEIPKQEPLIDPLSSDENEEDED
jgi:hypothetical protein